MEIQERLAAALADRYALEEEIGSGGMASVYLARDLKHDREVAVKVLDPDLAQTLGAERFLREIKTAANLTHPHILPVFDSGEADGFLFYVMPFVKGESLRTRLTKERQLPVEDAVQITREIADALAYAHEEGVVHRDVKPANIMLEAGHAVLADFGVAHAVSEAKDERITRTGTSLGTPAYMSPEQAMGELDPDGRTDQYALGCVLFEMLAGHPPFSGAQVEAVVRQHLTEAPPSVTQARPSVTEEIVTVINRALAKSPADRFKTTGEMAAALALTTAPAASAPAGVSFEDRPLWQVALGWALVSLVVFAASGTLKDVVGLPSWVPTVVGLICLGALPLVLAAARKGPRQLPWRVVGFAVGSAFVFLGVGTGVYMGMRVMGIGPVGTLVAQGVLEDQARLLVADLASAPEDSVLAATLSEGFRIDLASSDAVDLVDLEEVQPTLRAMQLPPGIGLTEPVAREAAVREGIPVVLVGDLARVGSAYHLTARLIDPEEETVLLSLREDAADEEGTLDAVDRLVGVLRERMGESLRSVNNREPLHRLTTPSLESLKAYTRASHAAVMEGDDRKAIPLLEEALERDSLFAMAWRKLGVVLYNLGTDRLRRIEAVTRAYELSDRLPEHERLSVLESYYGTANIDRRKAIETLELGLERYPRSGQFWNNLGVHYLWAGEYEKSRQAALESVGISVNSLYTGNLISAALRVDSLETARWALQLREEHGFDRGSNLNHAAHIAYIAGDWAEARRLTEAGIEAAETGPARAVDLRFLARLDATEGRLADFHRRYAEANELWAAAGNSRTVFLNQLYLAQFDAIVLDRGERARARVDEATDAVDFSDTPPIDRPYMNSAYGLAAVGRADAARTALADWEAATPEGLRPPLAANVLNIRGLLDLAEGRTEAGLQLLQESVRASFGHPALEGELALAYDRLGIPDSAMVAHHRYLEAPNWGRRAWDPFYLARAYERLGQLHEERGEVDEAIKYHTLFADLWAEADPELQPRVEAARAALATLQGETPDGSGQG
jgi:tetratricopeptide (TPR) repeat protein